ncbi:hypothetical protein [Entomospira culicis]|uniref:DUF7738 domain-containing protein n=1 Tax=Entomospira culicis TaxID=2719989 RepID=A0A968GGU0_9SPIO|nr:hypothetical protein [Entomospira culicis]NIZ19848.1 hypothetical protein [Entomospira culicis]NIZ70062.1 hypothetical protein [Entomospira culicis]WDI37166.1 hypothetical protein PVA46_07555 [Entomospira culicis]WDI38795.1 hypothetical protein PVA47_07565 [Entomospira culicis]
MNTNQLPYSKRLMFAYLAMLALFFVFNHQKRTQEARERAPITIELLPDGFSIDGKEVAFGMTMDEVRAILGKPRRFSGDRTFVYHGYALGFTDDMGVVYLDGIFLDRDNPNTTLLIDEYAFRYHGDYTLVGDQLAEIAHRHDGKVLESGALTMGNHYVLINPRKGSSNQIDTIFVFSWRMQPRAVTVELEADGFKVEERKVRFGMTKEAVIAVLGEPSRREEEEDNASHRFTYKNKFVLNFIDIEGQYLLKDVWLYAPFFSDSRGLFAELSINFTDSFDAMVAQLKSVDVAELSYFHESESGNVLIDFFDNGLMLLRNKEDQLDALSYGIKIERLYQPVHVHFTPDGFLYNDSVVSFGMNEAQVEAILGAPDKIATNDSVRYDYAGGGISLYFFDANQQVGSENMLKNIVIFNGQHTWSIEDNTFSFALTTQELVERLNGLRQISFDRSTSNGRELFRLYDHHLIVYEDPEQSAGRIAWVAYRTYPYTKE